MRYQVGYKDNVGHWHSISDYCAQWVLGADHRGEFVNRRAAQDAADSLNRDPGIAGGDNYEVREVSGDPT